MIIITGISSVRGIRAARRSYSALTWHPLGDQQQEEAFRRCLPNQSQIDFASLSRKGFYEEADDGDLWVLVADASHRRNKGGIRCTVFSGTLPHHALMQIEPDICCTSPAFTALLYARSHTFAQTFMLIMELLGAYTLPPEATFPLENGKTWPNLDGSDTSSGQQTKEKSEDDDPPHISDEDVLADSQTRETKIVAAVVDQIHNGCEAATTLEELEALAAWTTRGIDETFRRAVRYAAEGSRSPAESVQYGMFGLPHRYGGFNGAALPQGVLLNFRLDFNDNAVAMADGMPYADCDLYIPAAKSDIEYNGIGHELVNSRIHDANRNNGLQGMGVRVIVIDRKQMASITALEAIAETIHRFAGVRYRYQVKEYRKLQDRLLNDLRKAVGMPPV